MKVRRMMISEYQLKSPKQAEVVAGACKKIEETVVGVYKKVEDTVVGSYKQIEGKFVDAFLEKKGDGDKAPSVGGE